MKKYLLLSGLVVLGLASCSKDEPHIENEEELITTLQYKLTPVQGGETVVLEFKDLDGDGSGTPVVTNGELAAFTQYNGMIQLLNETESPAEDINEEILEEDEDHQFFYSSSSDVLAVTYNDKDEDGNPIGLSTKLTTKGSGASDLTITLLHEPNKSGDNVSSGDATNAGGEEDIKVTFNVTVK